jgi:hypothetical protein
MTRDERLALFKRDLEALQHEEDASVIFNLPSDENTFVQFSHERLDDPLWCEASNCAEGGAEDLDAEQQDRLRALGFEVPTMHEPENPHREYSGDASAIAEQVELIFRTAFRLPEDYGVESSGVVW